MPIPPESTKIHGITDDMVIGKKIIDAEVETLLADVSLVIAHNAAFDRGMVEARLPIFQEKAWGCSFAQVPWKNEGISSAALEFIAYRLGFHFSGHRASVDCHALLEVLQSNLPMSGVKAFKILLDAARTPNLKLWALVTPFETKDILRERGYRWDSERRTWHKTLSTDDLAKEVDWLRSEVYEHRSFQLKQETLDAYNRFSLRHGVSEIVNY
jgi:DNA polymerase-3 subunit epsilon